MLGIRTTFKRPPLEVLALIGMIYMRGLLEQAHQSTNAMFHEIFGNPVFSATMSRNIFKCLIAHTLFDNHTTHPTPSQHDRLVVFAKILRRLRKTMRNLIIFCCMKLFFQRERKLVSNNLIQANQQSMKCCINQ